MTSVTSRGAAWDAILTVASERLEFTVSDVIAAGGLDESDRRTVSRALREMESLGRVEQRMDDSPYWRRTNAPGAAIGERVGGIRILHVFADRGVEAEALATYGECIRIGWAARDTNASRPIRADANHLPIQEGVTFDLGVFHPPCARWADTTSITGDPDDHPNLIPRSREIAAEYCEEYIIENKPAAPLDDPVTLEGRMFGLPLAYRRSFETSFEVPEPPEKQDLPNECSPYFYSDRSRSWWASIKGYSGPYTKTALAKNAIPAPYIHFLMRAFQRATNERDGRPVEGHNASTTA